MSIDFAVCYIVLMISYLIVVSAIGKQENKIHELKLKIERLERKLEDK